MLSTVIFPFTFVHPFSVFSQIFYWRSQWRQSVVISDIPLPYTLSPFQLLWPCRVLVVSDCKPACSFAWSVANVRLTHSIVRATHTVWDCLLHLQFGKLLAFKFQDNIKSDVGCTYLRCFIIWARDCLSWKTCYNCCLWGTTELFEN